jgi:hypothetical protein
MSTLMEQAIELAAQMIEEYGLPNEEVSQEVLDMFGHLLYKVDPEIQTDLELIIPKMVQSYLAGLFLGRHQIQEDQIVIPLSATDATAFIRALFTDGAQFKIAVTD